MSGRESLGANDLRQLIFPEFNEGAQLWASGYSVREIAENLSLRGELAIALESHIRPVLDRYGLTFGRLEVREFKCEIWDRSVNMRVDTSLQVTEEQASLEGRKRLFDIAVEKDIQDLAEETQSTATYEKRIQLWERMQRSGNQEQINRLQSEQDLENFIRQADHDRLLKDDEFERFKVALREAGADKERLRAQFVRIAQMEQEYDYKRKELVQQTALSREQVEGQMGLERLRIETQLETELKRTDLALERKCREAEHRRSQHDLDATARWERELREARAASETGGIARERITLDTELALAIEGKQSAQRRLDQQEAGRIELEKRGQEQELAFKAQDAELDRRLRELKERHDQELDTMRSMDAVSIHTLIAVAPGETAPLLADLARTEALKSLSPDQILAMASEKNPELGGALAEIATKGDNEQAKAMYERLLVEQRESAAAMRESQREMTQTMQEMFNKALETQSQVAQAFASGGGQPGQPQASGTPTPAAPAPEAAAQRVVVCRRCLQESPVSTKYCPNCGDSLMAESR